MTSAHIFFIPGMIIIGLFFGFIFGARAARNQMDIERKREEERDVARAARAARRAEAGGKVDDRAPAEAKSPEVVSERKSDDAVADEKPAADANADDKKAEAKKDDKKADTQPEPTRKMKGKRH